MPVALSFICIIVRFIMCFLTRSLADSWTTRKTRGLFVRSKALSSVVIAVVIVSLFASGVSTLATAGPALTVNAAPARHAISPYIYGMNFADAGLAQELKLPVRRWGGNSSTRYNWQTARSNHSNYWYFEHPNTTSTATSTTHL